MDYYESPQIGGYRIDMPFPQLFYPEINSVSKLFSQSAYSNADPQSSFPGYDFESECKRDAELSRNRCNANHTSIPKGSPLSLRDSSFQSDFFDSGYRDADILANSCNMGYRPRSRSNQDNPFVYDRYGCQSRRVREMSLRNGLYAPSDGHHKHSMYPQYEGDPMEQSLSGNAMWR